MEASENLVTVTITKEGNKLNGLIGNVIIKYNDGSVVAQFRKSNTKGDIINVTLKSNEFKFNEESISEIDGII